MTKERITIEGPSDLEDVAKYQDYFNDLENYALENDDDSPQITFLAEEKLALERFSKFCSENPDEFLFKMFFRDEDGDVIKAFKNKNGEIEERPVAKKAAAKPVSKTNEDYDDILNYLDNLDDEDEDE